MKWVKVDMPKINQEVVRCAFFLYANAQDAQAGTNSVGTGFIVHFDDGFSYYGVSNKHVAIDAAPVIRLNTLDGVEIFDFGPEDWEAHPDGDDIAAISLPIDVTKHQVSAVSTSMFAQKDDYELGVGDDVFMVGLFADHEGREKNNPLARFGNISMLSSKDAMVPWRKIMVERHIVDMHSRGGYSGSHVFVYRTFGADLEERYEYVGMDVSPIAKHLDRDESRFVSSQPVRMKMFPDTIFKILGIQCSQFKERWKLQGTERIEEEALHRITDESYLSGASGMSCVAPAWKILEVLNLPKFVAERDATLAALMAQRGRRTTLEDQ